MASTRARGCLCLGLEGLAAQEEVHGREDASVTTCKERPDHNR